MEQKTQKPMVIVEEATAVLSRLCSLCSIMTNINARHVSLSSEDIAQVMILLYLCLDEQIKALDGIQWA